MCFPNKKQKNNFTDQPTEKPTKAEVPSSSVLPPIPQFEDTTPKPQDTITQTNGKMGRAPKVAIVIYTMYHHIAQLAEAIKEGIEAVGGTVDILQVPETLSPEILAKMYAPAKPDYPILTLDKFAEYDGWLFGIPTRYGSMPAQWKTFWDSTGGLWQSGKLFGKYAGTFVSTAGPGGGQETTAYTSITTFTHHGINYVPLGYGYKNAAGEACFEKLSSVEEVHGGSPWGAGTFASPTGTRMPTPFEKKIANMQGEHFWKTLSKVNFD